MAQPDLAQPERTRRGPLAGLRVLELAGIGPGPFCAMMLADQGATVLRIDRPGAAQPRPGLELLNRGRRSAVLDLKHPRATDALLRLADAADVLLEGLRPGVTERLGVGPEVCLRRNPRLVYARMTGWGQHGPLADTVGLDIGYIARPGALHALGRAGRCAARSRRSRRASWHRTARARCPRAQAPAGRPAAPGRPVPVPSCSYLPRCATAVLSSHPVHH